MATKTQIAKAVDVHLSAAIAAGKLRHQQGDVAVSVAYEPRLKRLHVELASGAAILVPVSKIQRLAKAKPATVKSVELTGKGYGLHWPALDLDVSVPDLVAGCFGSSAWMAALARQGGRATSIAKGAAARKNGKMGGRPRKQPIGEIPTAALA